MKNPNSCEGKWFKDVKTKTDSKLEAPQWLYKAHHRLYNIKIELKLCAQILNDQDSTHRKLSDMSQNICKSIFPALSKFSDVLNESGESLAPISLVKLICNCNQWKMMKDIADPANEQNSLDI